MSGLIVIVSLLLDHLLGEAKRFHPLVGFGNIVVWLEKKFNNSGNNRVSLLSGGICLALLVIPVALFVFLLQESVGNFAWVISVMALYWAVGLKSLREHIQPIKVALTNNDLEKARLSLSRIVSRDTQELDEQQITNATVETTLENGCDAVFGALFWFCLLYTSPSPRD